MKPGGHSLHSFAVGLEGSPDLAAARKVADHIGTIHHEINFTVQEGLDAIRDVIYHIETYDVTTIRASTPMYLLCTRNKINGSEDGSFRRRVQMKYSVDTYIFIKLPDAKSFHEETVRKISKLAPL